MATYLLKDADVAAVYFRTGRSPSAERLRQAPYLLVTYDDGTTGIVPVPRPNLSNIATDYTVADLEVDRIEIYDGDPYEFMKIGAF